MIIKVVFLPRLSAPENLKLKVYYVETDNFKIAEEKARDELKNDMEILSLKFSEPKESLIRYFDKIAIARIDVIKVT